MTDKHKGPRSIDQQIADAEAKVARLKEQARKQETAGKIILGGALLSAAEDDPDMLRLAVELIEKRVTRVHDSDRIAPLLRKLKADLAANDKAKK